MNSNKKIDELFDQLKQTERSDKARQDSLIKLRTRVRKKKKIHFVPTIISGAMLALAAVLLLIYNTEASSPFESRSFNSMNEEVNTQTIHYILKQEFTGPNEQFILSKKSPVSSDIERDSISDSNTPETIDQQEFLSNIYKSYFTESGYQSFEPYAFFYHLGGEPLAYQIALGEVQIVQNDKESARYDIEFVVDFTNSSGTTQNFQMSAVAYFAEEGILEEIVIKDKEGLSVAILENI